MRSPAEQNSMFVNHMVDEEHDQPESGESFVLFVSLVTHRM